MSSQEKKERRKWRKRKRYALTGLLLTVSMVIFVLVWRQFSLGERLDTVLNPHAKRQGPNVAPVKIIEYSDFQCPVCGTVQPILKELMSKYEGNIQLEFRHFPLPSHQWAALAHQAAECANRAGKFWEYHDLLYNNQPTWSGSFNPKNQFVQYAGEVGLDENEFRACLEDGKAKDIVFQDQNSGNLQQVSSTPTFFVNSRRIVGTADLKMRMELEIAYILHDSAST